MCQQQFQAEVMDELQMLESEMYIGCIYCGEPKLDKIGCCGENHFEEMSYE